MASSVKWTTPSVLGRGDKHRYESVWACSHKSPVAPNDIDLARDKLCPFAQTVLNSGGNDRLLC